MIKMVVLKKAHSTLLYFIFLFCSSLYAQDISQQINALKDSLRKKKGEDRILVLKDLGMKYRSINYDSALYFTNLGYEAAVKSGNEYLKGRLLISFGIFENGKGNSAKALEYYEEARPAIEASKIHTAMGALYSNMSNAYEKLGEVDKAVSYELKALKANQIAGDSLWIAGNYNNLASRYQAINEWELSKEYYEKASVLYKKLGHEYYVALTNNNLASVFEQLGDYQETIKYANRAYETFVELDAHFESAIPLYTIGLAHRNTGEYQKAKEYFEKTLEIQKEKGDKYVILHTKNDIAKTLRLLGNLNESKHMAKEAYDESLKDKIVLAQIELAKTLSNINQDMGDYKDAYSFLQQSVKLTDSLESEDRAKEVLNLKEKYEAEQKENEILRQKNALVESELFIKKRTNLLMGGGALLVILLLGGGLLFREQKLKQRNLAKEVALQKALAESKAQEDLKEQRQRIARDLHDNIGSQLTYLTSITDSAKRGIDKGEVFLMEKLTQMKQFSLTTISELRDTIWAMNKDEISLEDIKERCQELAAVVHESTDDEIAVSLIGNVSKKVLNAFVGMNVFRIIQESVNNAVKHSDSKNVEIRFKEFTNSLQIEVEDFGNGFELSEKNQGNGLHIMKNRAAKAGISFDQTSTLGNGTKITLKLTV